MPMKEVPSFHLWFTLNKMNFNTYTIRAVGSKFIYGGRGLKVDMGKARRNGFREI